MEGNITATGGNADTKVAFKNCAPFTRCEHVKTAENLNIIMPMYNLLEYFDNYAVSFASLYQFKRDKQNMNNGNPADVTTDDSSSFKYKSSFFKTLTDEDAGVFKNVTIAVPLKYLSNFFRLLEMPLINCKIHLELNWSRDCVKSTIADKTFQIKSTKLYVPVVTLSTKDNENLTNQLNEGFKRSVYWNGYKSKIETKNLDNDNLARFSLAASFQGVNRLFVLAFDNIDNGPNKVKRYSHTKYFLPRVDITKLIDGRNFYDQPINDQIKKYDEIRKIATGKGTTGTGCLRDYQYFQAHY